MDGFLNELPERLQSDFDSALRDLISAFKNPHFRALFSHLDPENAPAVHLIITILAEHLKPLKGSERLDIEKALSRLVLYPSVHVYMFEEGVFHEIFLNNLSKCIGHDLKGATDALMRAFSFPGFIPLMLAPRCIENVLARVIFDLACDFAESSEEIQKQIIALFNSFVRFPGLHATMIETGVFVVYFLDMLPKNLAAYTSDTLNAFKAVLKNPELNLADDMSTEARLTSSSRDTISLLVTLVKEHTRSKRTKALEILDKLAKSDALKDLMVAEDLLPALLDIFKISFVPYYALFKTMKPEMRIDQASPLFILNNLICRCINLFKALLPYTTEEFEGKKSPIRAEIEKIYASQGIRRDGEFLVSFSHPQYLTLERCLKPTIMTVNDSLTLAAARLAAAKASSSTAAKNSAPKLPETIDIRAGFGSDYATKAPPSSDHPKMAMVIFARDIAAMTADDEMTDPANVGVSSLLYASTRSNPRAPESSHHAGKALVEV